MSPRILSIVQIIFSFWSFEISKGILCFFFVCFYENPYKQIKSGHSRFKIYCKLLNIFAFINEKRYPNVRVRGHWLHLFTVIYLSVRIMGFFRNQKFMVT